MKSYGGHEDGTTVVVDGELNIVNGGSNMGTKVGIVRKWEESNLIGLSRTISRQVYYSVETGFETVWSRVKCLLMSPDTPGCSRSGIIEETGGEDDSGTGRMRRGRCTRRNERSIQSWQGSKRERQGSRVLLESLSMYRVVSVSHL